MASADGAPGNALAAPSVNRPEYLVRYYRVAEAPALSPPPPDQAETQQGRTEKDQTGRLRHRNQEGEEVPLFTARERHGVDVKIGLSVLDARDQRCLGLWDTALQRDKARRVVL